MGKKGLYEKLLAYGESGYYPFHMPGHKRRVGGWSSPFLTDITEIEGFDDLHHLQAGGILEQAQKRAAGIYGSEETHFLVNGSTAGILSAISGCTHRNGTILAARNCHRSVYHGIAVNNLEAVYVYPQNTSEPGISGSILPEDVEACLERNSDVEAVILTSPGYDGICSDVADIGELAHKRGIPLIVDQAHGAHFPFHDDFPRDAVAAGADVVIHSVHKTLPALTQTALIHMNGKLIDRRRIREYLSVYQTSSPSYVLMASIDNCMRFLEEEGREAFARYTELLRGFYRDCEGLKRLRLAGTGFRDGRSVWDRDLSKLLCLTADAALSGTELERRLAAEFSLQMEMSAAEYVLGISSVMDTPEGFRRLAEALFAVDNGLEDSGPQRRKRQIARMPSARPVMTIGAAWEHAAEEAAPECCLGRIAGSFIYRYPPGVPLVAPGEMITQEILDVLALWSEEGQQIHGMEGGKLRVLKA